MNFLLLALTATLVGISPARADEPVPQTEDAEELFSQGTEAYLKQNFAAAAEKFKSLASRRPTEASVFLNWGLSEYQSGRKGLGVALWRRALVLDPSELRARAALNFATQQMQLRGPDDSSWREWLRQKVLAWLTLDQMLAVSLCLLATSGWLVLTYVARRRKALRDELALPPFSWITGVLSFCLVIALTLTGLKTFDQLTARATAVTATPVRSAPSGESSTLFELREGTDVILRQAKKGWTQIHYPGGMSGWVPDETLFQTSGMQLW